MIALSDGYFIKVDSNSYTIGIPKKQIITDKKTGESKEVTTMSEAKYYTTLKFALEGWWEAVRKKALSEFDGSLEEAIKLIKEQDERIKTIILNFDITAEHNEPVEESHENIVEPCVTPRKRGRPKKIVEDN